MKKLVKIISWLFAAGSVVLIAGVFYIYAVLVPALPSIEYLEDTQLQVPLRVYDRNDVLLAEFGEHRRIPVDFEKIPTRVIDAFIAAEDDQFWNHVGVDPVALIAAAYELVSTGKKTRGGSTITMQVARNFFLSKEKTYARKLNEILLALRIESELSKEKILELYLNKIFLGHRSYGISAASQVYYGKPLDDLSIAQAAMIAGLPKAPSKYNPIINPERALIRRDHILGRMRVLNFIGDEVYELSRAEPVTAELYATKTIADANYVAELIRADLFEQYGEEVYKAGMNVYTSIDGELQVVANRALRRALLDYNRRHGYRGVITNINVPDLPESPIDYEIAEDMETLSWDPFGLDLVSDQRVCGLRKGVVISINQNLEPEEPVSADDPVLVEEPSTEAVEEVEIEDKSSATVMISNYQNIDLLFKGGIDWARTYIEVNKQGKAPLAIENVLSVGDVIWLEQRDDQWMLADIPRVEGAIVSIDATDGAIRAMVGGFDYFKNKFNRATQARRQPGSNFKPFIYSAALEKNFTAASIINDAPVVFEDDSLETTWRPENYSGRFYGPTRLREALVKSRNLVSIRILQAIGLRHATRYAERFGFKRANMPYDLSMALGSGTFSPLEIVRAYSVFANGGYLVDPYTTIRVETGDGKVIFQHEALSVCQGCELESLESLELELVEDTSAATNETISSDGVVEVSALEEEEIEIEIETAPEYAPRVISAQNAFIMRSMMREVVNRGTAVRAKALGRADIGGKTGTTNDQIDAWFSGFNDQVVTTAWVGFDNQQTLGGRETGGRAALPMWLNYMKVALDGIPENLQEQPAGLVTVRIDSQTGKRAGQQTVNSRFEIFRIENAPAEKNVTQSRDDSIAQTGTRSVESDEEIAEEIF
ncbi:MAG: penicillin-binding protein 1A [Gammaproteobacteria bacterium]|nr:penicillin-binding protein 1A [Gammaproteobacteria bacterium]